MIARLSHMRRRSSERIAHQLTGPSTAVGGSRPASVALTFDDGPDPEFTPAVLDALARHSVRATFFLIGERARLHPAIVRRIAEEGHAIGSHSRSHPDMWTISLGEVRRQYVEGRAMVEDVVGRDVPLVRPPKGYLDIPAALVLRRGNFRVVLWSATGNDWEVGATRDSILTSIGDPVAGAVVLLHDAISGPLHPSVLDRSQTVASLGPLIDRLQAAGRQFVGLS